VKSINCEISQSAGFDNEKTKGNLNVFTKFYD